MVGCSHARRCQYRVMRCAVVFSGTRDAIAQLSGLDSRTLRANPGSTHLRPPSGMFASIRRRISNFQLRGARGEAGHRQRGTPVMHMALAAGLVALRVHLYERARVDPGDARSESRRPFSHARSCAPSSPCDLRGQRRTRAAQGTREPRRPRAPLAPRGNAGRC